MTVDNALIVAGIVAGTSLLTIFLNNRHALNVKRIDAEQKLNEHKLSIRASYVTKKIEAGQISIGLNNIMIQKMHMELDVLMHFKQGVKFTEEFKDKALFARKLSFDISLERNDFTDLYFDIDNITTETNILVEKLESENLEINKFSSSVNVNDDMRDNALKHVDRAISLTQDIITQYNKLNSLMRNDLKKYDII